MSLLEVVELLELGSFVIESGLGWRFVLSSRYRRRTLERWRDERGLTIAAEVFAATIGIVGTVAGVLWVGYTVLA